MTETHSTTTPPVLSVAQLSKKYCGDLRRSLWYGLKDIAGELFLSGSPDTIPPLRSAEFWALQNVSFDLHRGESLAVIGANGAGKSTLLKVLYGLIKPDAGQVRINGRVGALIELGTGFNPILTGRENVRMNATVHGLSAAETDGLMGQIEDFAGIGKFMDTPVQYYSSGMKARLSYAVAAHLKPDVLMIDEVLAVGDLAYQRKCVNHILRYLDNGGTLIFVSHSAYQIQSVCKRAIVLERGRLTFSGTAVDALNYYLENTREKAALPESSTQPLALTAEQPIAIKAIVAEPTQGDVARTNEPLHLRLKYEALDELEVIWSFSVWSADLWICLALESAMTPYRVARGAGELSCFIPRLPLVAGNYNLRATIVEVHSRQPLSVYGWQNAPQPLVVRSEPSLLNNIHLTMNPLMRFDVEWE